MYEQLETAQFSNNELYRFYFIICIRKFINPSLNNIWISFAGILNSILNARRTNDYANNKHYCDLKNNVPKVPCQEYDIIDSNYNTIEMHRYQPSNNIMCMEGEYISVEPDGHLTTNIN